MSEVRVNNIVDYGGKGAPTFDNGAVISGVSSLGSQAKIGSNVTITSGGINVSGVTTAATLSGNLTGDVNAGFLTATSTVIGSGVTINAGGLNITGVCTATTFEGSGASLTGVAMTIAPLAYNPDVNDGNVLRSTGIGITFDHRILAGSGNVTLSIATNAGAAGTTVENFGVGSSVTIQGRKAIISPSSNLNSSETYHISYPSGAFTNTHGDVSYVGTAYTFGIKKSSFELWAWGWNGQGALGLNQAHAQLGGVSSPVQVPGDWTDSSIFITGESTRNSISVIKNDGTLWVWGYNTYGPLGANNTTHISSPTQIPGTTWAHSTEGRSLLRTKTDGTLWASGYQENYGQLGVNSKVNYSSPVQIGSSTDWDSSTRFKISSGEAGMAAIKTNGTLWVWGHNEHGMLGQNNVHPTGNVSSPVQVPGTTWSQVSFSRGSMVTAIKTDGTLWSWGRNEHGQLGQNAPNNSNLSSPTQIPGTTWKYARGGNKSVLAVKTDGTLWSWGYNSNGALGQNNKTKYSSPTQIPGTTWDIGYTSGGEYTSYARKTDGTLWSWGYNYYGSLGQNQGSDVGLKSYSSPIQVPGTNWSNEIGLTYETVLVLKEV